MKSRYILGGALTALVTLEAALWFFPLSDSLAGRIVVHQFLPAWNIWGGKDAGPPLSTVFRTGRLNGVSTTTARLDVNKYGFHYDVARAAELRPGELRIGAIGGSTVECAALEADKRWPEALEALLAKALGREVKVFNMGVSDQDTRSYLATTSQLAVKLKLDYVVFLAGVNDLFRARENVDPLLAKATVLTRYFDRRPVSYLVWFITRAQIGRRLLKIKNDRGIWLAGDDPYFSGTMAAVERLPFFQEGSVRIESGPLADYKSNLVSLAGLAESHGIKAIFLTQPMLWKDRMTDAEAAVDWLGTIVRGGRRYRLKGEDSARLLDQLNQALLALCEGRQWRCLDLAKGVPRTLDYFYDSVHFNEQGSRFVAEQVQAAIEQDLAR